MDYKKTLYIGYIAIFMFCLVILAFSMNVKADDTGYLDPMNFGANYNEWKHQEEAFVQDDTYATMSYSSTFDEEDYFEFGDFGFPGQIVVDGILVETDSYATGTGTKTLDFKLTWDGGSSWTSAKNTGALPSSDTDTYIQLGSSSDDWGHTWSYDEFDDGVIQIYVKFNGGTGTLGYCDHIRIKVYYTWLEPDEPESFFSTNRQGYCSQSRFDWTKGANADNTVIRLSDFSFPATPTSGTSVYNGTSAYIYVNYVTLSLSWDTAYYLSLWSWNETYKTFSGVYNRYFVTPCEPWTAQTMNNTGYYNLTLNNESWANVTWFSWFNDTNPDTLETVLNVTDQYINTSGGACSFPFWFNYSDSNITINITVTGCGSASLNNSSVNDSSYLYIAGLELDKETIIILVLIVLFILGVQTIDAIKSALLSFSCAFLSLGVLFDTSTLADLNLFIAFIMFVSIGIGVYKIFLGVTEGEIVLFGNR